MKTLKKISIYLIISLAVFACVEKDCFSFFDHSFYAIENITNEETSDNAITSDLDLSEVDVTLTQSIYNFNLKYLPNERVIISDFFFPENIYFHVWQPPKIS